MNKFEKKCKKIKKKNTKLGCFFIVLAIILIVIGISAIPEDKSTWTKFDGLETDKYQQANIYYLIGPFAEYEKEGVIEKQLYTAITTENEYILVETGENTELPILGEDVTEENINSIEPVTIYGYGKKLESDVETYLVKFWNSIYGEEIFTTSNYIQYFGFSYLDTEDQGDTTSVICYIFGIIFAIVAILIFAGNKKNKKEVETIIKVLAEDGKLEEIENEFSNYEINEYKKIKLDVIQNYIISYEPKLLIVPFADIINVYHSNMINGQYQPFMYIALETRNNEKYYIAQKQLDTKNPQFEEALEKIKSKVKQGGI